ncbi:hypothetical protein NF27_DT01920 [Candidatus Jidaibacter acanthamoeba]|uniref:Uncharacterized protein n=2 Tax=Candidatus Jidaibacter acanthamoebae TaxID=86105 RepID=A0A0C1QMZ4_9RICK|nr:hypothetical protein NF27_DT01920 [Candidatus Jidaibacter acanthamoeba]
MMKINKLVIVLLLLLISATANAVERIGDNILSNTPNSGYVSIPHNDSTSKPTDTSYPFKVTKKVDIKEYSVQSCKDLPLNFYNCSVSICYEKAPFGKIYRKVAGIDNGKCKYIERVENFGGINCAFPNDNLVEISNILKKHYISLYDNSVQLNDEETSQLKEIYKAYCEVLPSSSFTKVMTMNNNLGKNELSEIVEFTKLNANQNNTVKSETKPITQNDPEFKEGEIRSIMFTNSEAKGILAAVESFINLSKLKNQIAKIGSIEEAKKELTSFYLNSIIYLSNQSWSVWLNNYKVQEKSLGGVLVDKVNNDSVEFIWKTANLDVISPEWQLRLIKDGEYYKSKDNRIKIKNDNAENATIHFILKPNQTFVVDTLSIIEGKIRKN